VLSSIAAGQPILVLVFRDADDAPSMRLLLDYRDSTLALSRAGVKICAIAKEEPARLMYLRSERGLGFPLLADPDGVALSRWGMLDRVGLFLLDRALHVRQRALAERAPAEAMVAFVRRGGARPPRVKLVDRAKIFWHSLQHALRPRRLARR
jgi:peroxiredoxin